ncbi:uncharacterized protein LOC120167613 [Hibiscus syriacus]|uniref:uncharacterized protein LOC120167613 n=1 Tax=Hibiscus syriacus TaxID=106335 RepID=UPI0019249B9B|nr:uncharacterized protein LOC120167613 [Hibiscus syriacus]
MGVLPDLSQPNVSDAADSSNSIKEVTIAKADAREDMMEIEAKTDEVDEKEKNKEDDEEKEDKVDSTASTDVITTGSDDDSQDNVATQQQELDVAKFISEVLKDMEEIVTTSQAKNITIELMVDVVGQSWDTDVINRKPKISTVKIVGGAKENVNDQDTRTLKLIKKVPLVIPDDVIVKIMSTSTRNKWKSLMKAKVSMH